MNISIVIGTARIDRVSAKVAAALQRRCDSMNVPSQLVDVRDHVQSAVTVPPWGEGGADTVSTKWKEIVAKTDAFVFVLPEYNHSFPGEWKILMDTLYTEYNAKKAYVVAVGGGQFAGARVMEHVLPILNNFQFDIQPQRIHVAHASKVFSETGEITDKDLSERLDALVESWQTA